MKALVVGAGICGPVTAMALRRAGIDATVYEAHDSTAGVGSYLTVATNGFDALRAINAHDTVRAASFPTPWTVLLSGTGRHLGRVPIGSTHGDRDVSHTIRRTDFHRVLHDEARRRGIRIEFGRKLVAAETRGATAVAHFADGSTAAGDLLIGCDGVHSPTRS